MRHILNNQMFYGTRTKVISDLKNHLMTLDLEFRGNGIFVLGNKSQWFDNTTVAEIRETLIAAILDDVPKRTKYDGREWESEEALRRYLIDTAAINNGKIRVGHLSRDILPNECVYLKPRIENLVSRILDA